LITNHTPQPLLLSVELSTPTFASCSRTGPTTTFVYIRSLLSHYIICRIHPPAQSTRERSTRYIRTLYLFGFGGTVLIFAVGIGTLQSKRRGNRFGALPTLSPDLQDRAPFLRKKSLADLVDLSRKNPRNKSAHLKLSASYQSGLDAIGLWIYHTLDSTVLSFQVRQHRNYHTRVI
jgi:hypothetical protein